MKYGDELVQCQECVHSAGRVEDLIDAETTLDEAHERGWLFVPSLVGGAGLWVCERHRFAWDNASPTGRADVLAAKDVLRVEPLALPKSEQVIDVDAAARLARALTPTIVDVDQLAQIEERLGALEDLVSHLSGSVLSLIEAAATSDACELVQPPALPESA